MVASLCGLRELIAHDPAAYRGLSHYFTNILKQAAEGRLGRAYEYHRAPAPFVQLELLRLLGALGAGDADTSEHVYAVVAEVKRRAEPLGNNIGAWGREEGRVAHEGGGSGSWSGKAGGAGLLAVRQAVRATPRAQHTRRALTSRAQHTRRALISFLPAPPRTRRAQAMRWCTSACAPLPPSGPTLVWSRLRSSRWRASCLRARTT